MCIQHELQVLLADHVKDIRGMLPDDNNHNNHLIDQSSDEENDSSNNRRQHRSQPRVFNQTNNDVISPDVDNLLNRQNNTCQRNYNTPANQISDDTWVLPRSSNFHSTIARGNQGGGDRRRQSNERNNASFNDEVDDDDDDSVSSVGESKESKIESLKAIKLRKQILMI